MRKIALLLLFVSSKAFAQNEKPLTTPSKKGSFTVYWGWNRSMYSNSDITFKGDYYDFTLYDVQARDRQSPFSVSTYLNPGYATIPQYNLRVGYFINHKYQISLGVDHMKYVMRNYQMSTISGTITNSGTPFDGVYDKEPFLVRPEFLTFEHTDGLNYINSELRRNDKLFTYKKVNVNLVEGIGAGVLVPRTNSTLLRNPRYDQFHLAGFGVGAVVALNVEFYDRFYIQSELKAGFIDLPSIRTTMFEEDIAKQHFWYLQGNVVLGVNLNTKPKK